MYEELISFIDKNNKGWLLRVRLDVLTQKTSPERIQEVKHLLREVERQKLGRLFEQPKEVFIYFPQTRQDDMQALVLKINFKILWKTEKTDAFYTIYNLGTEGESLQTELRQESTKPQVPAMAHLTSVFQNYEGSMPFTPVLLTQLEKALLDADLSNIIRHQPVCAIVGKSPPLELFEEIYVAINDLKKAVCPNVEILGAPWLFNRLMETLDKRVLENVSHHDGGAFSKNFSLNLTVKTVLGQEFAAFDETIAPSDKETIFLELKHSDIFANIESFLAAKDFIRQKGYRMCIDMASFDLLPLIDREKLGIDMIKIIWDSKYLRKPLSDQAKEAIKACDPARLILCRVDDEQAIAYGQALGISIFQGYLIQKLLYKTPKAMKISRL